MRVLVLISAFTIAGCAAHSGVTRMGGGQYLLAKQSATGFAGTSSIKAELLREASQFCGDKGQDFEATATSENAGPFILGNYPRAEVQFKCVSNP